VFLGSIFFLSACSTIECASNRPNIILISANYLESMDVQEYAHHMTGEKKRKMFCETPNLDRLCQEGLCFEQASACSSYPVTHAGILAGRINASFNGQNASSKSPKGNKISIPGVLPDYDKAFIGKWHSDGIPATMGFDQLGLSDTGVDYSAEKITDQAVRYITSHSSRRSRPFFLYLNHYAADASHYAKAKDIKHFSKKRTRGRNADSDPQYAACVKGLDDSVGRILHKLWRYGLEENTVVIFMPAGGRTGTLKKSTLAGCNLQVPLMIRWKKHVKAGSWSNVPVDYADILPTVMQCGGYFPESLGEEVDGCSLSGLFWDAENKYDSYERRLLEDSVGSLSYNR
jgi:N-sulfoglucosamine sulfohydrolase